MKLDLIKQINESMFNTEEPIVENVSLQLDGVDVETLKYAVQLALDALRDDVEAPEDYLRSLERLQKQLHR